MRSGQRRRADGATLDCSRPGALRPDGERVSIAPVSYTHLTLPTKA